MSESVAWDAGEIGCGELLIELRKRLREMAPGELLQLVARDPGAREDLPTWCNLTGHKLVKVEHPLYVIQRKDD